MADHRWNGYTGRDLLARCSQLEYLLENHGIELPEFERVDPAPTFAPPRIVEALRPPTGKQATTARPAPHAYTETLTPGRCDACGLDQRSTVHRQR